MASDALADFPVLEAFGRPEFADDPAFAYRAAHAHPGPGIFRMHNGDGLIVTAYRTLADLRTHSALGAQNRNRRGGPGPVRPAPWPNWPNTTLFSWMNPCMGPWPKRYTNP